MAIKAISQFDAAIPTTNDKILFEQNGEGKSCNIGDLGTNIDLLWTNLDIDNEFSARNIALDLTQYKCIIVDVIHESVAGDAEYSKNRHKNFVFKDEEIFLFSTNNLGFHASQNFYYASRSCKFDNSKVVFGDSYVSKVNSSSAATTSVTNNTCIPYKIYGVK